jgi:hypothetical protein
MERKPIGPRTVLQLTLALFALVLTCLMVSAQVPDASNQKVLPSLTGKYEGSAKGPGGDVRMTLDLADAAGKFSGHLSTGTNSYEILKGQMADGLLSLDLAAKASTGKLSLRLKDDKLSGELTADGKTGPVEFRRAAKDEISGEWEAAADAQGQAVPFTLTLKLEGDKVTGGSSSQLGDSTISNGSWKEGKLAVILDGGAGQVALVATIVDGKLVGDFDYAGQLQGKWVATRKKQ